MLSQFCTAFGPIEAAEMACVLYARSTTQLASRVGLWRQRVLYTRGWPASRRARRLVRRGDVRRGEVRGGTRRVRKRGGREEMGLAGGCWAGVRAPVRHTAPRCRYGPA